MVTTAISLDWITHFRFPELAQKGIMNCAEGLR